MRFRAPHFVAVCVGLAACDSGEDPTPLSTFAQEDTIARSIYGHVTQGTEPVEGALVLVSAAPNLANDVRLEAESDPNLFPRSVSTDAFGNYRLRFAPLQYDVSVRNGRDAFVFRDLSQRFFWAPLVPEAPVRGFKARVLPATTPPPAAGNAIAYFVSSDDARTIVPSEPGPFTATFRRFDSLITVHAVEYVASLGLASAVAEGQTDVRVLDGAAVSVSVRMARIATKRTVTFVTTPPPGYTVGPLDIDMDFTPRTSAHPVARVMPGSLEISVVSFAHYGVRATATRDGAVSSSGHFLFDPNVEMVKVPLPPPVTAESPIDELAPPPDNATASLAAPNLPPGGVLAARITVGVVEHSLVPVSGDAPAIHVATTSRATTLPDVTRLGLPRPSGRYTWTFEHFPDLLRIGAFSGEDARVSPSSWKSAPRAVVLP